MAGLHSVALSALALVAAGFADGRPGGATHRGSPRATVRLSSGAAPGSVTIDNRGGAMQWVARALTVERRVGARWLPIVTSLDLIAACDPRFPRRTAPVRLLPGQSVAVMPWTGFGCGGQCPATCRANVYQGEGPFRIVATLVPSGERVTSPIFSMPPRPKPLADHPFTLTEIGAAAKRPRAGPNDP